MGNPAIPTSFAAPATNLMMDCHRGFFMRCHNAAMLAFHLVPIDFVILVLIVSLIVSVRILIRNLHRRNT